MTAVRIPLRAGTGRAGWPVVTWATGSDAAVRAGATTSTTIVLLQSVAMSATATAKAEVDLIAARLAAADIDAVATPVLLGLRAVPATSIQHAIAVLSMTASIWAPAQPERRLTYRRYTRADYHQMLMDLLPRGRAWPRDGEDAALMLGWATEYARVEQRGWDLLDEVDPRTTKELMPDWERFFELPGTASEEQRRKELIAEWLAGGSMSRNDIDGLLKALGVTASVKYWRPFRCGVSVCGDALATDWFSTMTVTVYAPNNLDLAWLQEYLRKLASGGDYVHVVAGY